MDELNESKLARRKGESEVAHRALLLFAMQSPTLRNKRATSRAVERGNATIHGYAKTWNWEDRLEGLTIEAEAQQLYRQLYFEKVGMKEIAMIEKNILSPITVVGNSERPVADTIQRTIEQTRPEKKPSVFDEEMKRKHLALIDAGIGYIAQGMKSGDLRRSLRDLPILMGLRREILGVDDKENKNSVSVIESARMRFAKQTGGDLVVAMYEDAQELVAVLGALANNSEAPNYEEIENETIGG